MSSQDLVITGLGLVLPCGDGVETARAAWAEARPCFREVPPALGAGLGAPCLDFNPAGIIPPMQLRRLDRPSRFAWAAAHQALQDAGLDPKAPGPDGEPLGTRIGVASGTLTAGSEASEAFIRPYLERGPEGASPLLFPNCVANAPTGHVGLAFGLMGPSSTHLDRENAALSALEQGRHWLRQGQAEAVLVLGTDGLFPLLMEICRNARLSARRGLPKAGGATGFLPGEGAEALILETRAGAEARGARVRAVLRAFAVRPALTGDEATRTEALARCLEQVLEEAGPVDAWIGGSSGHPRLDAAEAELRRRHPELPAPRFPKELWGEMAGSGGQLLAAALLSPARKVLVTAPASFGTQTALVMELEEALGSGL